MNYVYDTSFVGALIIPDEKNPSVEKFHIALDENKKIFSPQLLWYEIANIFYNLIRRKRYTFENILPFFSMVDAIGLTTDFETGFIYSQKLFRLSVEYNLSSYDTAYLELAERKNAMLCTLDSNLTIAAKKHGVKVLTA
jgi:predicted nucleic acid-binding protein